MQRLPEDAHLDNNTRPERAGDSVLPAFAHLPQPVEDAEESGARRVAVVLVHIIARSEVVRRKVEQFLNPRDDLRSAGMQSPVEILRRREVWEMREGRDAVNKGVKQGWDGGAGEGRYARRQIDLPACDSDGKIRQQC